MGMSLMVLILLTNIGILFFPRAAGLDVAVAVAIEVGILFFPRATGLDVVVVVVVNVVVVVFIGVGILFSPRAAGLPFVVVDYCIASNIGMKTGTGPEILLPCRCWQQRRWTRSRCPGEKNRRPNSNRILMLEKGLKVSFIGLKPESVTQAGDKSVDVQLLCNCGSNEYGIISRDGPG
jgi:hypothetical protein